MNISLNLILEDINLLLQVLGDLPIKTGLHNLAQAIQAQAKEQVDAANNAPKE